ncbi:MAG: LAGLIDADG family homing endonuclease [Candidatus Omnitrophica bacterium]|nr:LAGLIDADG family homing endonuclease [Candidatus Omnitrophota bacterium]
MAENKTTYQWSPELAYIVGLITTDGSLSCDRRHITMVSRDLQLLKTFRKCLNLRNRISKRKQYKNRPNPNYQVTFGNVSFYHWLQKIGLMPNKTYNLKELLVPKNYLADYLRGFIDGDGSIFTYADRYMCYKGKHYTYKRLYVAFNSLSKIHLSWIKSNLEVLLGLKGGFAKWSNKHSTAPLWTLRYAKNDSLKLLPWIYYKEDLPCLKRKRKIADRFLRNLRVNSDLQN